MTTNELIEAFINDNNYLDFVVKELKELRMPDEKVIIITSKTH
mgnify:CR=1 FL=1